jgi:hypothetical protein
VLPVFCSHEQPAVRVSPEAVDVWHSCTTRVDPETEHLMLQIAVATADRLLGITGGAAPRLALIELPPHPDCGFDHPERWFGTVHRRSDGRGTHLLVEAAVAGKPFPKVPRDHLLAGRLPALDPIRGDGSFDGGVRTMLASLMSDAVPTIRDMARISGTSERTFQ